jgi:hypothetical protein
MNKVYSSRMHFIGLIFLALALSLIASCSDPTPPEPVLNREDEAIFVVLHTILDECGGNDASFEHFVSVSDGDPSPELIDRLNRRWIRLKPASASYLDKKSAGWPFRDRISDNRGVVWQISAIRSIDESTIEVTAGYYASNLGAHHCDFRLRHVADKWEINAKQNCWAS